MPEPARKREQPLGALLCERGPSFSFLVLTVVFLLFAAALPWGVALLVMGPSGPTTPVIGVGPLLFMGTAGVLGFLVCLREIRARIRFFEHGCVRIRGNARTAIRYADATMLSFRPERQDFWGLHISTSLRMTIKGPGRAFIRYSGTLKERQRGLLNKRFESTDELLHIRAIISTHMARSMLARMREGHTVDWCGEGVLTLEGFVPRKGRHKGKVIAFDQIDRQSADDDSISYFLAGEDRALMTFSYKADNFHPCHALFWMLSSPEEDDSDRPWIQVRMPIAGALPNALETARAELLSAELEEALRHAAAGEVRSLSVEGGEIVLVIRCDDTGDALGAVTPVLEETALPAGTHVLISRSADDLGDMDDMDDTEDAATPERIDIA